MRAPLCCERACGAGKAICSRQDGPTSQPSISLRSSRAKRSSRALTRVLWTEGVRNSESSHILPQKLKKQGANFPQG
jgi:hypothetical protein